MPSDEIEKVPLVVQRAITTILIMSALVALFLCYWAWQSGGTFRFSECQGFPNYNMLAGAFLKGQLFIDETQVEDCAVFNGKTYMYAGPGPALLRIPFLKLFGTEIPTGLFTCLFTAGIALFFALIIIQFGDRTKHSSVAFAVSLFVLAFCFNGYSVFMVTIPLFHHEAITGAMFFFMAGLFVVVRARREAYQVSAVEGALVGLAFAFCIASRIAYLPAVAVLMVVLLRGMLRQGTSSSSRGKQMAVTGVIGVIVTVAIALLLTYNYARFDNAFEFGTTYLTSWYEEYFLKGYYFRYDHIPYNVWSYFFRVPSVSPEFPFIGLPAYIVKVQSIALPQYILINVNELSVSVFTLMPMLILCALPAVIALQHRPLADAKMYLLLLILLVLQVLVISLTVAATARYYYDFLPIMMILCYRGALALIEHGERPRLILAVLAGLSVVVSQTLPLNAIHFYSTFINYQSPLLRYF
ncbi:MAG: hypothetical protein AB1664_08460 [Thermodesulfobacteriota bacterium]